MVSSLRHFRSFFPIIANGPYECFAAFQVFVMIVVVLKSFKTIACSQFLENEDNLPRQHEQYAFELHFKDRHNKRPVGFVYLLSPQFNSFLSGRFLFVSGNPAIPCRKCGVQHKP